MRRTKLESHDQETINRILMTTEVGSLGIVTLDGCPRVVPVDFVWDGRAVHVHGAVGGEKFDSLKKHPTISFSVYQALSVIPTYWLPERMVGATHFYKSVQLDGEVEFVDDLVERVRILELFMRKYQPEGKYESLSVTNDHHLRVTKKTQVFSLPARRVTCKVKVGQDMKPEVRKELIQHLLRRGRPIDLITAEEVRATLPS